MKKFFLVVACAYVMLLPAAQARAQQNAGATSLPFAKGEELFYQAEFKRALLRGIDVGEFRFSAKPAESTAKDGSESLQLVADVASKGFFTRLAGFRFHWHVEDQGLQHVYIKPRTPQLNGKVERSHRTDDTEFYQLLTYTDDVNLTAKLEAWENFYNYHRPHMSLDGQTPYEVMRSLLK